MAGIIIAISCLMLMTAASAFYYLKKDRNTMVAEIRGEVAASTETEEGPQRQSLVERWEQEALQAGLDIQAREFILIAIGSGVVVFIAAMFVTGTFYIAAPCLLVGLYAPKAYINRQKNKRLELFNRQLEKALMLAANTIRVGHGLQKAIANIAETPEPLGYEFKRAYTEMNLGVPTEEALGRVQRRVNSPAFGLMVTAIKINRQVGGNMITMFDRIAETIREGQALESAIKAATTRGRTSAYIVIGIPYTVLFLLGFIEPEYLSSFRATPIGRMIIMGSVIMNGIGLWIIHRMTKIEE